MNKSKIIIIKSNNKKCHSADEVKRMESMELRLAVRKGNAQAKLGKVTEAIAEYERALRFDPANTSVKKDLEMLRKTA